MGEEGRRWGDGKAVMVEKRQRHPMKRTISTMGLSTDLGLDGDTHHHHQRPQASDRDGGLHHAAEDRQWLEAQMPSWGGEGATGRLEVGNDGGGRRAQKPRTCTSPEGTWAHGNVSDPVSPEFLPVATTSFLRACGLCRRPLGPGKDTFIYRGEIAFCSLECRQQQIAIDEWTEKCSFVSIKNDPSRPTARPKSSRRFKTTAAA